MEDDDEDMPLSALMTATVPGTGVCTGKQGTLCGSGRPGALLAGQGPSLFCLSLWVVVLLQQPQLLLQRLRPPLHLLPSVLMTMTMTICHCRPLGLLLQVGLV